MLKIVKQKQNYKGVFSNQCNLKVLVCVVPVASDSFQGPHTSAQAYKAELFVWVCPTFWLLPGSGISLPLLGIVSDKLPV